MAARKPSKPTKPVSRKPLKAATLGNDPFARGSAVRSAASSLPLPPAVSPSLSAEPQPHANSPLAVPLVGPMAHRASPSLSVDPHPHAAAPSGEILSMPAAHPSSPTVIADPQPHAHAPRGEALSGHSPHNASPTLKADPTPHAGAPFGEMLSIPAAHPSSPTVVSDPQPHSHTPRGERLSGHVPHNASPTLKPDPTPHASAPSVVEERASSQVIRRDLAPPALPPPTLKTTLKGIFNVIRSAAGFASRVTQVDRWGKDESLSSSLRPLADLLYEKYWRVQVEGADLLPTGPFIIVANHAGALPLDGPVMHMALRRERPDLKEARWLLEDQLFHAPILGVMANRLGAVRANPENALRLLEEQRPLIIFPEGFQGLSKPFSERYQLKRFGRGGYLKVALRAQVPIIPTAIVGGEESMPLLGKVPGALLGLQYLPITLPPLPARWHIRFGAPISLSGAPAQPEDDLSWVERKNAQVRDQIEGMLTQMLKHRHRIF